MTDITSLIERLIASGADPIVAACVVAEAFVVGKQAAPYRDDVPDLRSPAAKRQANYRERLAAKKAASVSENITETVTNVTDVTESVTRDVTASRPKRFSLSPVPLLSPTPPNNPLTPKPSSKNTQNARGMRLPEDWTLCEADLGYALGKGLTEEAARELFEKFCNWAWSASGQNAVKRNWHRAWQNWVIDAPRKQPARAGPSAKPLTEHQRAQQETKDILHDLDHFARGSGRRGQEDTRLLSDHSGERSEGLRSGVGEAVIDLPRSGYRSSH